jgi:hypothetical membrane protein
MTVLQHIPYPKEKMAGMLFFVAATQFVLCFIIAEALYPGYIVHDNYISDLGVGPSAIVFNISVFLLGLLLLAGIYFLRHTPDFKTLNILLLLMAIGAMGVGIVTKDYALPHGAVASMAFFFAGLSANIIQSTPKTPLPAKHNAWSHNTCSISPFLTWLSRKRLNNQHRSLR